MKEIKAELISEQAALSTAEGLLRKKNEEIRTDENALQGQSAEVEALKAKIADLEKVNSISFFNLLFAYSDNQFEALL